MKEATATRSAGRSFWHTLTSLWDTLALSAILGLVLMFVGSIGVKTDLDKVATGQASAAVDALIWAVIICMAVAYGKVASKGDPTKTAGAGAVGAVLAAAVTNLKGGATPDLIDGVRVIFYPILGWTVTKLERLKMPWVVNAWKYLVPMVIVPGIAVGLKAGFWKGVAEVIFAVGCALILHSKKLPRQRGTAPAHPTAG